MRILIVGNGGREHALLWKLRRDAPDAELFITRGNGGTESLARHLPLDPADAPALGAWAQGNSIDLTVVGPEGPLAEGIVDTFLRYGLAIFGPSKAATEIESSKSYAKRLMRDAEVPTAGFATFTELAAAARYIAERPAPLVVKASGLAAGKGAVVCRTTEEALSAARTMLEDRSFGAAGEEIVVEDFLEGEEISVFALSDGTRVVPMLPAQDHKRIGEGDTGPNTGGMGAYTPVGTVDPALIRDIAERILQPTVTALREDERPFRGLLYAGLMLTPAGPKVVEFNARFGDPETQVVLPMLDSSLLEPLHAIGRGGSIEGLTLAWRPGAALTTVLAAAGYPGPVRKGDEIRIPPEVSDAQDLLVFHAGTKLEDGRLVTAGGRVLAVTALAPTMAEAAARSRAGAEAITFEGRQLRRDIGWRELARGAGAA